MESPITVQKVSTSIIWRIYGSQAANENGGECLLQQTAFCERWGSNLFFLRGAVLFSPSDCHSFNEELTYLRGMIQEKSIGQHIGCGSKMDVRKAGLVCVYVCVRAFANTLLSMSPSCALCSAGMNSCKQAYLNTDPQTLTWI